MKSLKTIAMFVSMCAVLLLTGCAGTPLAGLSQRQNQYPQGQSWVASQLAAGVVVSTRQIQVRGSGQSYGTTTAIGNATCSAFVQRTGYNYGFPGILCSVVGNAVVAAADTKTGTEIFVRLADNSVRTIVEEGVSPWRTGDQVLVKMDAMGTRIVSRMS